MVAVGIDVAKDKHDCFIISSEGEILYDVFTIRNNQSGFEELLAKIMTVSKDLGKVKVGLEATGHYSYNILAFLLGKGLPTYVLNPLSTGQYRKSMSLRKTKTDKVDARAIAGVVLSNVSLKPYSTTLYYRNELKSLTRYRFDRVGERSRLKVSVSRLVTILFPELESFVSTIHIKSVYTLLSELPGASYIADCDLQQLIILLEKVSRGKYRAERTAAIHEAAKHSVGTSSHAKSMELRYTIRRILEINEEIEQIEKQIKGLLESVNTPILGIPGIGTITGAMIVAEIGDFSRFSSPDKVLAFAGCSPTTYQSGRMYSSHAKMDKRGSIYLRWALMLATQSVCRREPTFIAYLQKKCEEGKHYNVAITHAAKKLIRLIYHLETTGDTYKPQSVLS